MKKDIFAEIDDGIFKNVVQVDNGIIKIIELENGALVNGTDLPNGLKEKTAVYLGSIIPRDIPL